MKRKKTWLYVCLTLLMLALTPAAVYGEEPDGDTADKTRSLIARLEESLAGLGG